MPDRKILTDIASTAWEHPADRAALNALRALPLFDEVVRKVVGFFGDTGVRQLFLANAVLVGPDQRPGLHELYEEVLHDHELPHAAAALRDADAGGERRRGRGSTSRSS